MATKNRRVAAYLPSDLEKAFEDFKAERGLGESKALIAILAEYFGVSQKVTHPVALDLVKRIESIEERLAKIEKMPDYGLPTGKLAARLGIAPSTLSHWKSSGSKGKSPDELLRITREKDPDGIGWSVDQRTNTFLPERPLGSKPDELQGELLNSSS